jgi:hypothetical protein
MDRKAKERVTRLVAGLQALLDEARRGGSPVEAVVGARDLLVALKTYLAGNDRPLKHLLGLVNEQVGVPGRDTVAKIKLMRQFRELRAQGVSRDDAANKLGVDQRTLSRWRHQAAGVAEEIDARLGGVADLPRGRKRKGQNNTLVRPVIG